MNHEKRIFALGFFDGVHLGHQALLAECVRMAKAMDVQTAAITFESHPQSLFRSDVPPLLTTLQDRFRLLLRYGIEHVYPFPVNKKVMSTPWEVFLEELMGSGAVGFVCGHDFRFGSRGEGNAEKLRLNEKQARLVKNGNAFASDCSDGTYRVYAPDGEFLALCRAEGGKVSTIKSFFEV